MIIRKINELEMRFVIKLMACKLLRNCHKEEAPTGVIAAVAQCVKGSLLSLAPYLVNLFLDDCKDAQDLGSEFHYPWLIILIALVGWGEPKYSGFYQRPVKCHRKIHILMEYFRSKEKEGECYHVLHVP
jgi:hypothetical protein